MSKREREAIDLMEKSQGIVLEISIRISRMMAPESFTAWLCGTIASVVGALPDDYWEGCKQIYECGEAGCDCHLELKPKVLEALDLLRNDFKKYGTPSQTVQE